jgi:uncharacterized protein YmfQ (DUF2313 family)
MNTRDALVECLPAVAYVRSAPNVQAEATSAARVLDTSIDLADVLAREQQPDLTAMAFVDWERNYGLPDARTTELMVLVAGLYGYKLSEIAAFSRASVASYYDASGILQYAPANQVRYSYNPANLGVAPALLIEGAAMNLLRYSEQLDNAAWVKDGCSVVINASVAPDGTTSMDKIVEGAGLNAGAGHKVYQALTSIVALATYKISFYAKAAERTVVQSWSWGGTTSDTTSAFFNLSTGTASGSGAPSMVSVGGGIWRCTRTITTVASQITLNAACGPSDGSGVQGYSGDGTSGIYIWGVQVEAGELATTYIPTNAAAVTRAEDTCSVVVPPSEAQRRSSLLGRLKRLANLSRQFMVDQAAALGYPGCTVTEFGPMTCQDSCDGATNSVEFIGVWKLNIPIATTVKYLTCESSCDAALASWGNSQLEYIINRRKPAHTKAVFAYAI